MLPALATIDKTMSLTLVDSLGHGPTHPSISEGIILQGSSYHGYLIASVMGYEIVCEYLLHPVLVVYTNRVSLTKGHNMQSGKTSSSQSAPPKQKLLTACFMEAPMF